MAKRGNGFDVPEPTVLAAADIHVAIASYGRAGHVSTLSVMPWARVWVPESQEAAYVAKHGRCTITVPDECDGNLCRKRNAILDRTPCKRTLLVDDDLLYVGGFDAGKKRKLSPSEIAELLCAGFALADDLGVTLWGLNVNDDSLCYDTYRPFALLSPIMGPFGGHLAPGVRYDESMAGHEDVDFWLKTIREHKKTLRFNAYHYKHDHGKLAGGHSGMRSAEQEADVVARMRRRWGRVFRPGGRVGAHARASKGLLNQRVYLPVPGM